VTREEARVGALVRSNREFSGVPKGTGGVIDQDYGSGVMVAWHLKDAPLPPDYRRNAGRRPAPRSVLRDGFDKDRDLQWLDLEAAPEWERE
jgi:hypothetical protein